MNIKKTYIFLIILIVLFGCIIDTTQLENKYKNNLENQEKLYQSISTLSDRKINLLEKKLEIIKKTEAEYNSIYPNTEFIINNLDILKIKSDFPEKFIIFNEYLIEYKKIDKLLNDAEKKAEERELKSKLQILKNEESKIINDLRKINPNHKYVKSFDAIQNIYNTLYNIEPEPTIKK